MLEGPEARITAEELHSVCANTTITRCQIWHRDKIYNYKLLQEDVRILNVASHGKNIIFQLENDTHIFLYQHTLARWKFEEQPNCWILFTLNNEIQLSFRDDTMDSTFLVFTGAELQAKLSRFGPDLISEDIDLEYFTQCIHFNAKRNISLFLLTQNHFCGIGAYLKSEILYASQICPKRICESLSNQEIAILHYHLHLCIRLSYYSGGMKLFEWKSIFSHLGSYVPMVYRRKTTFTNCIVIKETIAGRVTYYSPYEQV